MVLSTCTHLSRIHLLTLATAELLEASHTLEGFNKPSRRDYQSVKNYFAKEAPLVMKETDYIYCKEDLLTLKHTREAAWVEAIFEKVLPRLPPKILKVTLTNTAFESEPEYANMIILVIFGFRGAICNYF